MSALNCLKLPSLFSKALFFDVVARFNCLWQITALYIVGHRASVALCYGTNERTNETFNVLLGLHWGIGWYMEFTTHPKWSYKYVTRFMGNSSPVRSATSCQWIHQTCYWSAIVIQTMGVRRRWLHATAALCWLLLQPTAKKFRCVYIFRLTINAPTVYCLNSSNRLLIVFHPYIVRTL